MWECRKCGQPVYFAERKQSLGFDWHPKCLRCEECGKRLNPGQHAEHKGVPYCHHPCYGALFGPQLFGHGTRNECHTSFGKVENRDGQVKRSHIEAKLKAYNQYYEGKPGELKHREANGRLILEGVLKIYWGVCNVIHLKEEDDQRTIAVRRRSTVTAANINSDSDDEESTLWRDDDTVNGWRTPQSPSSPLIPSSPQSSKLTPQTPTSPLTLRFPKISSAKGYDGCSEPSSSSSPHEHSSSSRNGNLLENIEPNEKFSNESQGKDSLGNELGSKTTLIHQTNVEDFGNTWRNNDFKTCREVGGLSVMRDDEQSYSPSQSYDGACGTSTPSTPDQIQNNNNSSLSPSSPLSDSPFINDNDPNETNDSNVSVEESGSSRRSASKTGSTAIRRRPGRRMNKTKLKRRCSINGHFYLRETSTFTPPHGSPCSVWVTSLVTAAEVLNMLLEKYRIEMASRNFALFVIKDNGERRRIRDEEYPLITRVMLGPHEEVARVFIVDAQQTPEISPQVAQFLNLSLAECRAILQQYEQEELRQIMAVRKKYEDMAFYIQRRMKELRGV
ncbi:hypothetical protein Pmani_008916 [Petrolisthes manimaculis]|uniref:Ras association domain-containing protein 2 n=1 Tax=Petrolisthes manimaculis TaxID=1843537 RepID=A0AAE1UIG9_9EUCA|nr:hypothetical protein Pmani_008916 [Petrolisthes manimaculis]